jgi:ferritin-like metal-binding protein YciE
MALEAKRLHEAFVEELKDLYSAESMLIDALPKMEKAASNDQLKQGFSKHHDETKNSAIGWIKYLTAWVPALAIKPATVWKAS